MDNQIVLGVLTALLTIWAFTCGYFICSFKKKKDAIGFAEWLKDNSYIKSEKGWYKFYTKVESHIHYSMSSQVYEFTTIEELYNLYLLDQK